MVLVAKLNKFPINELDLRSSDVWVGMKNVFALFALWFCLFVWLGWMQIQFVSSFHYHHRTSATEGSITNRIERTYGNHKEIRTNILFTFHQTDANTNKQTKATETFQFISKMNSHFWGCKFCIAKGAFSGELGSSERTSYIEIIENLWKPKNESFLFLKVPKVSFESTSSRWSYCSISSGSRNKFILVLS